MLNGLKSRYEAVCEGLLCFIEAKEEMSAIPKPAFSAAFSFDTHVSACIDDPDTSRLFPAFVQC